jgi:hypothetical protein
MGISAGAIGLGDVLAGLFGGAAAAAPEAAAAIAPEAIAGGVGAAEAGGALALPEIAVTAAAPAAAAAAPAAATGFGAADVAGLLGAGALGITPAAAAGLTPSTVVGGEFGQLPGGGAGPALPITAVPGFLPGGAPTPAPAPAAIRPAATGGAPGVPGIGGGSIGYGGDVPAPSDATDPTVNPLAGPEFATASPANPNVGGQFGEWPAAAAAKGGASGFFGANPGTLAMLGLGGASLGAQLLNKSSGVPYLSEQQNLIGAQQALAQQQGAYGTALQQPLLTGQLPPGQQAAVAKGLQDAISTIKGRYDALNLTGSSMEADAIANAKNTAVLAGVQIEQQMAQTGQSAIQSATQALGMEAGVYNTIMNAVLQQDQNLANAVSGFANAAALGTAVGAARQPAAA